VYVPAADCNIGQSLATSVPDFSVYSIRFGGEVLYDTVIL